MREINALNRLIEEYATAVSNRDIGNAQYVKIRINKEIERRDRLKSNNLFGGLFGGGDS